MRPLADTGASKADKESNDEKYSESMTPGKEEDNSKEDDVRLPLQPLPLAGVEIQTLPQLEEDADVEECEAGERDDDEDDVPDDVVVDEDEVEVVVQLGKDESILGRKFELEKLGDVEDDPECNNEGCRGEGLLTAFVANG